MTATDQAKQAIRERVWSRLEQAGVVEPGVAGYIPNFRGADEAASWLAALPVWQQARVIKAVPDRAQLPVRVRALNAGKLVYMAAPRLATPEPFYALDPERLPLPAVEAADRETAARVAPMIGIDKMRHIDLVVVGSVAVNARGERLGKGAGYSDLEVALLVEAKVIDERTIIATTVHDLQVLDEGIPEAAHDFRVDVILTPKRAVWCEHPKRPAGIDWVSLRVEQIEAIPVLARQARQQRERS